jgi:hypothetical protein
MSDHAVLENHAAALGATLIAISIVLVFQSSRTNWAVVYLDIK